MDKRLKDIKYQGAHIKLSNVFNYFIIILLLTPLITIFVVPCQYFINNVLFHFEYGETEKIS